MLACKKKSTNCSSSTGSSVARVQENSEGASTDVYEYCLKNSGPVKARPSDFEFAVHEISNNGELAEELEEFGIF